MRRLLSTNIEKWLFILLILVLGITPILYFPSLPYHYDTAKYIIMGIIIGPLMGFTSFWLLTKDKGIIIKINLIDALILTKPFLIYGLFLHHNQAIVFLNKPLLFSLLFLTIKIFLLNQKPDVLYKTLKVFVVTITTTCIIECIMGFLQFIEIIPYRKEIVYDSMVIGSLGIANSFGSYIAIMIILLIGITFNPYNNKKIWLFLIICIATVILCLTKSRGAIIALIISVVFLFNKKLSGMLNFTSKKIFKFGLIIIFLVAILIFFYWLYTLNIESSLGRIYVWKITMLIIISNYLAGVGYQNFTYEYVIHQAKFLENPCNAQYIDFATIMQTPNNQLLFEWTELGITGLLLFLLLFIFIYLAYLRISSSELDAKDKWISKVLISTLLLVFIHSIVFCPLNHYSIYLIFIFVLVCFSYLFDKSKKKHKNGSTVKKRDTLSIILAIIVIIISSFISVHLTCKNYKEYIGYSEWIRGNYTIKNNFNLVKGIEHYQNAVRFLPNENQLRFELGLFCLLNGDYQKSIEIFEYVRTKLFYKEVYLYNAKAYIKIGDMVSAISCYESLIHLFPNLLEPKFELGKILLQLNQKDEADKIFKEIIENKPKIKNEKVEYIKEASKKLINHPRNFNESDYSVQK